MAFFNGSGGAGDATTDSTSQAIAAVEAAAQAAISATQAANSATESASSASASAASASNALSSANAASASATNAATSANASSLSATESENQATLAATSASSAATSASTATGAADLAEDWAIKTDGAVSGGEYSAKYHATAAASSASNASTSASDAATSASDAATSASTASTAATNAAASYDSFDDRYLGAKSSAPSVDNDGNSLITGALYWDTVSEVMQVWDGSAWVDITQGAGGSGTVTSVAMSVPTGLSVAGSPITSSGTLAVTYASGYAIPTTTKQIEWDTAYGWGNHASAGYLTTSSAATTYQPLDGDLTAIAALSGTSGLLKKTAANTYTLDTSTYLTSYTETDPIYSASAAANVTNTKISNWDTAYGWGNHASAGYLDSADIGVSVQAYDADLTSWAAITPSSKQDTLVSGTNIKTVNSNSLLGSGNVSVGTVTSITAGTGLSGGTITGSGTIAIDSTVATLSGTQTLSNKTLEHPVITGTILEDVYTITDGAGFAIDPTNGSIQLITLGASRTPTAANWDAGESVTLMVADGTAYTITWTTIGVVWVGGSAPTLATSGYTVIELWKVGSTIYGALVGSVA